jgi:hypothetical protein
MATASGEVLGFNAQNYAQNYVWTKPISRSRAARWRSYARCFAAFSSSDVALADFSAATAKREVMRTAWHEPGVIAMGMLIVDLVKTMGLIQENRP